MNRLKGKVAVVTGGAAGIGAACVHRMAEEGACVVIADLHEAGERANGGGPLPMTSFIRTDVSREDDVAGAIAHAHAMYGRLDILVNNAGIAGPNKPTHLLTEAEWDSVQSVNVKGVFYGVKHAIAPMREAGGGSIINLSSIYGIVGAPDVPPYHASKGAVRMMTKTDALLYAPDKIRVNSIHPGFILTPMVEGHMASLGGDRSDRMREIAGLHPLGRMGHVDEVAWCAVFLASDEASFVTGAEIVVDGGYTAR